MQVPKTEVFCGPTTNICIFLTFLKAKPRRSEVQGRRFSPYVLTGQSLLSLSIPDSSCPEGILR